MYNFIEMIKIPLLRLNGPTKALNAHDGNPVYIDKIYNTQY